jgi:hypothetical protein
MPELSSTYLFDLRRDQIELLRSALAAGGYAWAGGRDDPLVRLPLRLRPKLAAGGAQLLAPLHAQEDLWQTPTSCWEALCGTPAE